MNKVILIGNLTKEPTGETTKNGTQTAHFIVAVNRGYNDADGNAMTDYFRCVAWRKCAERCLQYLHKGSKVCVDGLLTIDTYTKKDGSTGTNVEIIANSVEFLNKVDYNGDGDNGANRAQRTQHKGTPINKQEEIYDDDIPF